VQDFYQYLAQHHRETLHWIAEELNDILTSPDTRYQFNIDTMKRLNHIIKTARAVLGGGRPEPPPKGGHAGMT